MATQSEADGDVLRLTYTSTVTRMLSVIQLVDLIEEIRPKNERLGVTGLLLYSGGNVIQTLEGETSTIESLFDAILSDEGHRVLTATNGHHGLEVLARDRPDLMFLDYMMPVMDGAAVLLAMGANPALPAVPVVMMSSMTEATVAERCSGYVAFLRKPFKIAQVMELAGRLLAK